MAGQSKTIILTIVRHGQTDENINKNQIWRSDNPPVNSFGKKQAQAAGKALKNVTFDQAYSSDLQRANQTCQLILEENQLSAIGAENIKQDQRIKEKQFGESKLSVKNRAKEFISTLCELENAQSILIVSHRSLIHRMFHTLFHEMNCSMPSDLETLPDLSPRNTAISKFNIEIYTENNSIKAIQCKELFNVAHLNDLQCKTSKSRLRNLFGTK